MSFSLPFHRLGVGVKKLRGRGGRMGRPMCSKECLNAQARAAGVRSRKLFTTAVAKGSIMGTRAWSAAEAFLKLERPASKDKPSTWT